MPVEVRLKFGTIVGLHDMDAKRQPPQHVVHEINRRGLIARVVDLEDANPRAVVDRGELIEPLPCARNALEKLYVHLQAMPRLRLFIALPSLRVGAMFLIRRQPVHPVAEQNAVYRRHGQNDVVKPLEVVPDPPRAEVVVLAQVERLTDDVLRKRPGRAQRPGRPVT